MSVQDRFSAVDNHLNNKLEALLKESRREMHERTQVIILGIDSQAMAAKKDVHHHIRQFVKVRSALSPH